MNKLLFAIDLLIRQPREPEWERLEVGKPLPESDRAAFFGPRRISAVGGTLQVFITALIHPLAGLLLALNTYHIKYSAQVYLEGIPGLMAILSAFLFEKSCPPKKQDSYDRWPSWSLLVLSAASLGFAAAGKYLYALVGFVILAFLISRSRSFRRVIIYCFVALAVFLLADPFLWPNPAQRLWESLTFHWRFAHSDHVVASAMPWYSPFVHLLRSAPTKWHPGVFYTGLPDLLVFPLSFFGIRTALRERPIWLTWAAFGLFVLLLWPTKWPQYILVVLPPLAVCAGLGIQQILAAAFRKLAHGS